jgi:hypothetical protein
MAEMVVAARFLLGHPAHHLGAVIAVKAVTLDEGRPDTLAAEDLFEGAHDRGGAGAGRAGNGNDRMTRRH